MQRVDQPYFSDIDSDQVNVLRAAVLTERLTDVENAFLQCPQGALSFVE